MDHEAEAEKELTRLLKNRRNRSMPGNISSSARRIFYRLGIHWRIQQQRLLAGENIYAKQKKADKLPDVKASAAGDTEDNDGN